MDFIKTSKTDERFIADIMIPGVPEEAVSVTVRSNVWDGFSGNRCGHDFTVKVRADRLPDTFCGNKYVTTKLTETFEVDIEFDLDKIEWTYKDGVVRVSVPKAEFAIGKTVAKSDKAWVSPNADKAE